jgi:hypothetical protein
MLLDDEKKKIEMDGKVIESNFQMPLISPLNISLTKKRKNRTRNIEKNPSHHNANTTLIDSHAQLLFNYGGNFHLQYSLLIISCNNLMRSPIKMSWKVERMKNY